MRHFVGHPAICEECEQRCDRGAERHRQGLTETKVNFCCNVKIRQRANWKISQIGIHWEMTKMFGHRGKILLHNKKICVKFSRMFYITFLVYYVVFLYLR
mgnify:FL=1